MVCRVYCRVVTSQSHHIFSCLDYRGGDHSEVIASGNSVGVKCPSDCEMVVDFGDRDTPICTKRKQCDDETEFIGDDMVDYDTGSCLMSSNGSI